LSLALNENPFGLVEGARVWVGGHNLNAKRVIAPFLTKTIRPARGPIDTAFLTPQSADEAIYFAAKLWNRMGPGGRLWIVWPISPDRDVQAVDVTLGQLRAFLADTGWKPHGQPLTVSAFRALAFHKPQRGQ
jgi:hypothetical protein